MGNLTYSIADAIRELGLADKIQPTDEAIVLNVQDKFFVGGGCEVSISIDSPSPKPPKNISICSDHLGD
jgi:hypothetical protein